MIIYCLIFILLSVLAAEYEINTLPRTNFLLAVLSTLLILFAGFRGIPVSRDYEPYLGSFRAIMNNNIGGSGILPQFEPAFVWIVKVCHSIFESNGAPAVMLVFAALSIPPKLFVFRRIAVNPFLALLLYYVHYFFLQEMTQIRNGMACSLFFLALYSHLKNKPWQAVLFILAAMLFHNSAVLYFLLFLIRKEKLNGILYLTILAGAILLGILKIPIMTMLTGVDLNQFSNKLTTYVGIADRGFYDRIRFFNVLNIINVLITAYLLLYAIIYKEKEASFLLFLKCNVISIFTYGLLIDIPSVASRFSEIFGAAFPLMLASGARFLPFKKLNIVFIICIAAAFLYINIFYGKLVNEYQLIRLG